MQPFIFGASLLFFWFAIESVLIMAEKKESKYGWLSFGFFVLGAFGIYALIVGR